MEKIGCSTKEIMKIGGSFQKLQGISLKETMGSWFNYHRNTQILLEVNNFLMHGSKI